MTGRLNAGLWRWRGARHHAAAVLFTFGCLAVSAVAVLAQQEPNTGVFVVDQRNPRASDDNPGTLERPLMTIAAAVLVAQENNARNVGSIVRVYPGIYRESVRLERVDAQTSAPITLESVQGGAAIISGSDLWQNWDPEEDGIYSKHWPAAWGMADQPWVDSVLLKDIVRRREMVFVNGTFLQQVLSRDEMHDGTFYVDEQGHKIFVQPGERTRGARVEVAQRDLLLYANQQTNLTIRGFVFQHASTAPDGGAVWIDNSKSVTLEDNVIRWNNWTGLRLTNVEGVTTRRNLMVRNGGAGWNAWRLRDLVSDNDETSLNNWRGHSGGFTGWAVSGLKHLHVHGARYSGHRSVSNQTGGFWLDTDAVDVLVDGATWCGNLTQGLFLEAVQGPVRIQNSTIALNRERGVFSSNSKDITLANNQIYANGFDQIRVFGLSTRTIVNFETGQPVAIAPSHWRIRGNLVAAANGERLLNVPDWPHFLNTLHSDRNLWFAPQAGHGFKVAREIMGFPAWRELGGLDSNSSFRRPMHMDLSGDELSDCYLSKARLARPVGTDGAT